jgi:hypothetical protein
MKRGGVVGILVAGSAVALVGAANAWRAASTPPLPHHTIALARAPSRASVSDSALDDAEDATVSNDPFRLSNEPAAVRYDPSAEGESVSQVVPVVRPTLILKAIIGGPPWQAVIDGIPGQPPGTIAAPGARFDKLVVWRVTRDTVVVKGPDTTWSLGFKGGGRM